MQICIGGGGGGACRKREHTDFATQLQLLCDRDCPFSPFAGYRREPNRDSAVPTPVTHAGYTFSCTDIVSIPRRTYTYHAPCTRTLVHINIHTSTCEKHANMLVLQRPASTMHRRITLGTHCVCVSVLQLCMPEVVAAPAVASPPTGCC